MDLNTWSIVVWLLPVVLFVIGGSLYAGWTDHSLVYFWFDHEWHQLPMLIWGLLTALWPVALGIALAVGILLVPLHGLKHAGRLLAKLRVWTVQRVEQRRAQRHVQDETFPRVRGRRTPRV